MKTKECFKCGIKKPLTEFYKHSGTKDGHLGKCKECAKLDVRLNYRKNKEYYQKYDIGRNQTPERKKKQSEYQVRRRENEPEKYYARTAVGNAIRDGRLIKKPCIICGSLEVEGHHEDYNKPLDVIWLCRRHHRELEER